MLRIFFILGCFLFLSSNSSNSEVKIDIEDRCIVCFDKLKKKAIARLSCKHVLHLSCLEQWNIEGRNSCPTCQTDLRRDHTENFSKILEDRRGINLRLENIRLQSSNEVLQAAQKNCLRHHMNYRECCTYILIGTGIYLWTFLPIIYYAWYYGL